MKKAIAILISALMVMSIFCLSASAAAFDLAIGSVEGAAGETVVVPVTANANAGIQSFQFELAYDAALTLVNVEDTKVFDGMLINKDANPIVIQDAQSDITSNSTATGVFANVSFTIPADAAEGTVYEITGTPAASSCIDCDFNEIETAIAAGSIKVVAKAEPTDPTQPSEEPADPTEPSEEPAEPTQPSEAPVNPTDAPVAPTTAPASPATGSALPVAAIVLAVSSAAVLTIARKH